MAQLPWAVTASVAFRNSGGLRFRTEFLKTGGGEDVDACLQAGAYKANGKTRYKGLLCVPEAQVTHPWWAGGRVQWARFFNWSFGDSLLIDLYRDDLVYRSFPSGPEIFAITLTGATILALLVTTQTLRPSPTILTALQLPIIVFTTDFVCNLAREFCLQGRRERHPLNPSPPFRALATLYATSMKYASEFGKMAGHYERHGLLHGPLAHLALRFDWFGGFIPHIPKKEVCWAALRCMCYAVAVAIAMKAWPFVILSAAAISLALTWLGMKDWLD